MSMMSGESSMGMSSSDSMEGIGGDIGGFTGDRGCGERCGAGDLARAAGADGFNVPSPYHDPKPQQWPVKLGSLQSEGRGDGHAGLCDLVSMAFYGYLGELYTDITEGFTGFLFRIFPGWWVLVMGPDVSDLYLYNYSQYVTRDHELPLWCLETREIEILWSYFMSIQSNVEGRWKKSPFSMFLLNKNKEKHLKKDQPRTLGEKKGPFQIGSVAL